MSTPTGSSSSHLTALSAEIERLERRIREAEAQRLRFLAETFDIPASENERGIGSVPSGDRAELAYRSVRAEIATALHQSEHVTERQLNLAHALAYLYPRTFDEYCDGTIFERHAQAIVECGAAVGADDSPDAIARRAAYETEVLVEARVETATRLRPIVRGVADRHAETTLDERQEAARRQRRVFLVDAEDGMSDLVAHLPAVEAHAIHQRLTAMSRRMERSLRRDGRGSAAPTLLRSTRDERRADLFSGMLLGGTLAPLPSSAANGVGIGAEGHASVDSRFGTRAGPASDGAVVDPGLLQSVMSAPLSAVRAQVQYERRCR